MGVFSVFSAKRRKDESENRESPQKIYASYSRWVGYIKYIMLLVLVVFVFLGFSFFSEELTLENFKYMLKFITLNVDATVESGTELIVDFDKNAVTEIIAGDIAISDENGIQIYDVLGERYLKQSVNFENPLCISNGSNIITCGFGLTDLYVFSTYTEVYKAEFEYPIYDLYGTDNGYYALLTAAKGLRSVIEVYDGYFRRYFRYYFKDDYITTIGLANDGKKAVAGILSNTLSGSFVSKIYIFDTDDTEKAKSFEIDDEIPWDVYFTKDGTYYLMTNKCIRIYAPDDSLITTIDFGEHSPKGYCFSDKYIALCLAEAGLSDSTIVNFYNSNGVLIGENMYYSDVTQINLAGDYALCYAAGTLYTVFMPGGFEIRKDTVGQKYLRTVYDDENDRLVIVYEGKFVIYGKQDFISDKKTDFTE